MTAGEIIDVQSEIISMQAKAIRSLFETLAMLVTGEELAEMAENGMVDEIEALQKVIEKQTKR